MFLGVNSHSYSWDVRCSPLNHELQKPNAFWDYRFPLYENNQDQSRLFLQSSSHQPLSKKFLPNIPVFVWLQRKLQVVVVVFYASLYRGITWAQWRTNNYISWAQISLCGKCPFNQDTPWIADVSYYITEKVPAVESRTFSVLSGCNRSRIQ